MKHTQNVRHHPAARVGTQQLFLREGSTPGSNPNFKHTFHKEMQLHQMQNLPFH